MKEYISAGGEIRTPDPQREPDLKSGAVPLSHPGLKDYLLNLPLALMDGLLLAEFFLPVLSPLPLYPAEVSPL